MVSGFDVSYLTIYAHRSKLFISYQPTIIRQSIYRIAYRNLSKMSGRRSLKYGDKQVEIFDNSQSLAAALGPFITSMSVELTL